MKTRITIFWATLALIQSISYHMSDDELGRNISAGLVALSLAMLLISTEPVKELRKARTRREAHRRQSEAGVSDDR